jgi:FKBP-type peptidyl-prolyl cis-trans isomerase FkpA
MTLHARAIREEIDLAEKKALESYAFGLVFGAELEGMDMDYAAFAEGLKTALEKGDAKISRQEASEMVQSAFDNLMAERREESRVKETQFLAENGKRPEIQTTPSGLQYEVLAEGDGEKPEAADTVRVHYEGSLGDGTVFDSSYSRNETEEIPLDRVIPGWSEGLRLMRAGSKYRLYIPSGLAYGEQGAGQVIPPNATLIFTVELLEIIRPAGEAEPEDPAE